MEYKLILLVIILLFIGANLFCSCCRYPIFDYLMGRSGPSVKEGNSNKEKDAGTPGSLQAVKAANKDIADIMSKNQPVPPILNPPGKEGFLDMGGLPAVFEQGLNVIQGGSDGHKKEPFEEEVHEGFLDMGGLPNVFQAGMNSVSEMISGPPARDEKIVASARREGMTTMGANIHEVQNGDLAGMWVSKANAYASKFGYTDGSNTANTHSGEDPLNSTMLIFAKNKFKPECCPSPYSSSTGCVCMTSEQIKFLNTRGGNRTTDSGI